MASPPTLQPHARSVGYNLGMLMLAITLVTVAGAYGAVSWLQGFGPAPPSAPVLRSLLGRQLSIPPAWTSVDDDKATAGFASQVGLKVSLPIGRDGAAVPVEITLLPLSQVRTSISLLDGVYLHQFMPGELSGPAGLIGKPLYPTEGYADETVWYDALSPNPFVAKCSDAPDGHGPAQCLRTVALGGGIAAVYAFASTGLAGWKSFDRQVGIVLGRIGAL